MSLFSRLERAYQILHRYNPFRAEVGLFPMGNPSSSSPVFVSGNYATTVDELIEILRPLDCWLLLCDSAGINVWCAAGVGDFNEHKITDTIIASKLEEKVTHRTLILPPLAAVGVNRAKLRQDTGFSVVWGPAHMEDIPEFVRTGLKRTPEMRLTRFPLKDRFEQSIGIVGVFLFPIIFVYWWPRQILWFLFSVCHAVFGTMLGYEKLPPKYPANKTMLLALVQAVLISAGYLTGKTDRKTTIQRLFLGLLAHFLIAIDMIGSTPFFKSTIVHWLKTGNNESLFQPGLNEKCTSCGFCQEVCPKGLFERGEDKKIRLIPERSCCECLACIKQCPHQAIDNIGSSFKDDIKSLEEGQLARLHIPLSRE